MNENNIGLKIKELRSKKGLDIGSKYTGAMLAKELEISRSYLGDIESGRTTPSEVLLGKIADIFNTDIYELIGDTGNIELESTDEFKNYKSSRELSVLKRIDDKAAEKKYIEATDFSIILNNILELNISSRISTLRDNVIKLSNYEMMEFNNINGILDTEFSIESSAIGRKYISNFNKNLISKINKIIDFEISNTTALLDLKDSVELYQPVAAHNDCDDLDQINLMNEDVEEL